LLEEAKGNQFHPRYLPSIMFYPGHGFYTGIVDASSNCSTPTIGFSQVHSEMEAQGKSGRMVGSDKIKSSSRWNMSLVGFSDFVSQLWKMISGHKPEDLDV